jgi:hypothetical protein
MEPTIQNLYRRHFSGYVKYHRISATMAHAVDRIMDCRKACMGGHVNICPEGHYHQIAYNSCRHRSCPQCSWLPLEQWLSRWKKARLLESPHHHVIFTLPHDFNILWRFNKVAFTDVLFKSVSETLQELLRDPKYLGGRVGLLCALHTWNQTLQEHIHLHVLVTAGGLGPDGQWLEAKKSCLLPRRVLMKKFRGKFKSMLKDAILAGKIELPDCMSDESFEGLLKKVTNIDWNVKILRRYKSGVGVATYLARYLKGGPIGNSRLLEIDDDFVTFRYRLGSHEGGDGTIQGTESLEIGEFIKRHLEHIPPRRLQTVRGYGLYCGNQHSRIEKARKALGMAQAAADEAKEKTSWQDICEQSGMVEVCRCPKCGAKLISHSEFKAGRGPPRYLKVPKPLAKSSEAA